MITGSATTANAGLKHRHCPVAEQVIIAVADSYASAWCQTARSGVLIGHFDDEVRSVYTAMLADTQHTHAICEEYREAASVERDQDSEDRNQRRRITCPVLALWSANGPLSIWYSDLGGPLAIWHDLADHVASGPGAGGHFFPEEHPDQTTTALAGFLSGLPHSFPNSIRLTKIPSKPHGSPVHVSAYRAGCRSVRRGSRTVPH